MIEQGSRQRIKWLLVALAFSVSGCAAVAPSGPDSAVGLVAPSGEILEPPCPASAGCLGGFVVGDTLYGISCHGVEPGAVADEPLASGSGPYEEARAMEGIPTELWLAVRGDLACLPAPDQPLLYEWYLATGEPTQQDLQTWGERVREITLPLTPEPSSSAGN